MSERAASAGRSGRSHLSPVWTDLTGLHVVSGHGSTVVTADGVEYLDMTSGIAVTSTGHCHPHVVQAIQDQAARFLHAQVNVYRHDLLEPLAARLAAVTPAGIDSFFFASSGAEVVEAGVKLAKQVQRRSNVIVFQGGFHGRTHLAMAMTSSKAVYRAGYAPLPAGIHVAPFAADDASVPGALARLEEIFAHESAPDETAAVVIEPVLGEGGYLPAAPAFLRGVERSCRQHDVLFVVDEIQSGFGRTGRLFAVEHYGVRPDVLLMAKGLASGFPMSALGARGELMDRWRAGSHGGTYGGNPMACAAALATLDVIGADGFLADVERRGARLLDRMRRRLDDVPGVVEVRGLGLMVACELDCAQRVDFVVRHCLDESRVIFMPAGPGGRTVRWMPPLVSTDDELGRGLDALDRALRAAATGERDVVTPTV